MLAWPIDSPAPAIHTVLLRRLRALSRRATITAPPWSVTMQQWYSVSGQAISRASITSLTVIDPPNGLVSLENISARGFNVDHWRVTTEMCAKSSGVVPKLCMCRTIACAVRYPL